MELMNTLDLAEHLKVTRSVVDTALKNLGLTPVYEMAQGKGTVSIWDKSVVVPKLVEHFEAKRTAKPVQAALPLLPAGVEALQTHLDKRFDFFNGALNDGLDDISSIKEIVTKLADQNVLLHKALESLRMLVNDKLDALQATADLLPELTHAAFNSTADEPEPPAPASVAPMTLPVKAPVEPASLKRKIAVISLLADQKRMVEKEFGDVFDLRIFDGSEARTSGFANRIAGCEVALIMNNFTDRVIIDHVKKPGVKVTKVGGGLTRLRTELTSVFMNP